MHKIQTVLILKVEFHEDQPIFFRKKFNEYVPFQIDHHLDLHLPGQINAKIIEGKWIQYEEENKRLIFDCYVSFMKSQLKKPGLRKDEIIKHLEKEGWE